jgi:hypothetical protein
MTKVEKLFGLFVGLSLLYLAIHLGIALIRGVWS